MFHIHRGPKLARRKSPLAGTKKVFGLQSSRLFMDARCRQCRDKYPGRSVLNDPRPQLTTAGSLRHQLHYMGRVSLCDPVTQCPPSLAFLFPSTGGSWGIVSFFWGILPFFSKSTVPLSKYVYVRIAWLSHSSQLHFSIWSLVSLI